MMSQLTGLVIEQRLVSIAWPWSNSRIDDWGSAGNVSRNGLLDSSVAYIVVEQDSGAVIRFPSKKLAGSYVSTTPKLP
jgi:hypothetical protein